MILDGEAANISLGRRLAGIARPGDLIGLTGPLGAGKTSIARGLLAELGLADEAPSPSFAIVQPYDPPEVRFPVLHVDLYRIEDAAEAEELGLEDARIDSLLLVEWPERLGEAWLADALCLTLSIEDSGARRLTARVPEAWRGRWPLT
ncbi:tRNA (adenosine(37)-N6)-threonylcarbamoyltransferase complex ATPase subunit type 1 TsaE [Stakelama sp. CBK3Z-3]|uniref:tRNA (Adenosine(37)-N6)-threonylcarbamoyltransferase complex ATPase subunit type 1 TsaE n=1 Tax=Stakelama flava TaxID=2860338 RepID=A0ABS6XH31_9SPHN|nr:tRNA (adenosine(37)-N6)-threonylcarbamoyltransferase complex ATPase subunit type 1 TsaE [Stakelama flava]MBW4329451.1 tRNA (adenosine(37)-N6)-threonylcarbamoyltransferase complex ATPase subunit type 1 TsaE [Stakelama flava]